MVRGLLAERQSLLPSAPRWAEVRGVGRAGCQEGSGVQHRSPAPPQDGLLLQKYQEKAVPSAGSRDAEGGASTHTSK